MSESPVVSEFLTYLKTQRNVSVHTLDAYWRDLTLLQRWLDQYYPETFIENVSNKELLEFISDETTQRNVATKTLHRRLSSCRAFYKWLLKQDRIKVNPVDRISAPKLPKPLPEILDIQEATQLVEIATDVRLGLRDRALLELLYSSALRLSELCHLHWKDLDLEMGILILHDKHNKQREIPVGRFAREALSEWRKECDGQDESPVFPGRNGQYITQRAIQIRIKKLGLRQGLFKDINPHMLRHTCASHLLDSSGDLHGLQELLGVNDIAVANIYTPLDFEYLSKVYKESHPRAKRKSNHYLEKEDELDLNIEEEFFSDIELDTDNSADSEK